MEEKKKRLYTKGEELLNAISHIVGGVFGIAALVLGIIFAVLYNDGFGVASMIVYGISLIIMYTMSSIYHFLRRNRAKKVFQVFDHCSIFLLIAGTYTPYCLVTLRETGALGWILFGIIWFMAILGIVFNAIDMHNKIIKRLSLIGYIVMGWCVIGAIVPLLNALPMPGFWLLVSGGIAYTLGAVFYVLGKKKKYIHSVWHFFVLAGSILQFFSILLYVII